MRRVFGTQGLDLGWGRDIYLDENSADKDLGFTKILRRKVHHRIHPLGHRQTFTISNANKKDVLILRKAPPSTATSSNYPSTILPIVNLLHHVPSKIPPLATTNPHNHRPLPTPTTTHLPKHSPLRLPIPLRPPLGSRPILLCDTDHHLYNLLHYKPYFPATHVVRWSGLVAGCAQPTPYDDTASYVLSDSGIIHDCAHCRLEAPC